MKGSSFRQNEYDLSGIYSQEYHFLFFLFSFSFASCNVSESELVTVLNMPCNNSLFSTAKFIGRYQGFFPVYF